MRSRWNGVTAGLVLTAGALAAGCSEPVSAPPPTPPEVVVATPEKRDVTNYQVFTGTTVAIEASEVRARVSGNLEEIHYEPRGYVEKGALLFSIEREAYVAARGSAVAALKSAEAELARAESDKRRIEIAIKTNAVSEQDLDLARARRDQAEASVLSAQAQLDRAELDLSYTEVRAPISGQVARNLVDVGNLVGTQDATLLTTINRIDPMFVYFDAPEALVLLYLQFMREKGIDLTQPTPKIRDEAPTVAVGTAADEGFPHHGQLDYIDNTVDPDTGTITLRAVIPNNPQVLFPGLFVRVQVGGRVLEDTVVIEQEALGTDMKGRYVYVVGGDGMVEARYVQLGPIQEDGTIAVLEGLEGTEQYIVEGILKARPGLPVTPKPRAAG